MEESTSQYSQTETETEFDDQESYEEKFERYRYFFDNRPLMRCLDVDEDQFLADLLFERLLREVQLPSLPFEESSKDPRDEVQIRTFWDGVRKQLHVDESSLECEWPEGYPEPVDGLEAYLQS